MTFRLNGMCHPDHGPRRYSVTVPWRLIVDTPAGWIEQQVTDLQAELGDEELSWLLLEDMSPACLDGVTVRTDSPQLAALLTTWVQQGMAGVERLAEMRVLERAHEHMIDRLAARIDRRLDELTIGERGDG